MVAGRAGPSADGALSELYATPRSFVSYVSSAPSSAWAPAGRSVLVSVTDVLAVFGSGPGLLGDLGDLERLGLLRLVRVLGAGVDLELAHELPAQAVLRQHAPHR